MQKFTKILEVDPTSYSVELLDEAVLAMNNASALSANEHADIQNLLTTLATNPDAWVLSEKVLLARCSFESKHFISTVLQKSIRVRWKSFSPEQKSSLKRFIIRLILDLADNTSGNQQAKSLLTKLNLVLIEVLKHDWPKNWPTFMKELLGSSQKTPGTMKNCANVLRLITEEVFENESPNLIKPRRLEMKRALSIEFGLVFSFFDLVLNKCVSISSEEFALWREIGNEALSGLALFLAWIPLGFVFETNLLSLLIRISNIPVFATNAVLCLKEVFSLQLSVTKDNPQYLAELMTRFCDVSTLIHHSLAPNLVVPEIPAVWLSIGSINRNLPMIVLPDERFLLHSVSLLCGFLSNETYLVLIERSETTVPVQPAVHQALEVLVLAANADDESVFAKAFEFWAFFTNRLEKGKAALNFYGSDSLRTLFETVLHRMRRPKEVLLVEDEFGNFVREKVDESDAIALFEHQRQTARSLALLLPEFVKAKVLSFLEQSKFPGSYSTIEHNLAGLDGEERMLQLNQLSGLPKINSAAWTLGCLSGIFSEQDEETLIQESMRTLLGFVQWFHKKAQKAAVAADIMFISRGFVGYSQRHKKFSQVVVFKLFEFFRENFPGVQEMSVETFLHVCRNLRHDFLNNNVAPENADFNPNKKFSSLRFIDLVIKHKELLVEPLDENNVQTFLEGVCTVLKEDPLENNRERRLGLLLAAEKAEWHQQICRIKADRQRAFTAGSFSVPFLLARLCRRFAAVGKILGPLFGNTFNQLCEDGAELFELYAEMFAQKFSAGTARLDLTDKECRNFQHSFTGLALDFLESYKEAASVGFVQAARWFEPVFVRILRSFSGLHPEVKEPRLLLLAKEMLTPEVVAELKTLYSTVFDAVVPSTLQVLAQEQESCPLLRSAFFELLPALVGAKPDPLGGLPFEKATVLVEATLIGVKHLESFNVRNATKALAKIVKSIGCSPLETAFYRTFYFRLVFEVLSMLLNEIYQDNLEPLSSILADLLQIVEKGRIKESLSNELHLSNKQFIGRKMISVCAENFRNMDEALVTEYVSEMFVCCSEKDKFYDIISDFYIISKQLNN